MIIWYTGQASWILSLSDSCPCESLLKTQKGPSSTTPFKKAVRNEWRRGGGKSLKINNINHHNNNINHHNHQEHRSTTTFPRPRRPQPQPQPLQSLQQPQQWPQLQQSRQPQPSPPQTRPGLKGEPRKKAGQEEQLKEDKWRRFLNKTELKPKPYVCSESDCCKTVKLKGPRPLTLHHRAKKTWLQGAVDLKSFSHGKESQAIFQAKYLWSTYTIQWPLKIKLDTGFPKCPHRKYLLQSSENIRVCFQF